MTVLRNRGENGNNENESFSDDSGIAEYAKEAIETMHHVGIMNGTTGGEYTHKIIGMNAQENWKIYTNCELQAL